MTVEEMIDALDRAAGYLGEHNKLGSKVAEIRDLIAQLGWHPASELPSLDKNGISQLLVCWCVEPTFAIFEPKLSRYLCNGYGVNDVKYWCYPPKNE